MSKNGFQSWVTLGDICTTVKIECCMFTPNIFANILMPIQDIKC